VPERVNWTFELPRSRYTYESAFVVSPKNEQR
jgi:hypothetical protein